MDFSNYDPSARNGRGDKPILPAGNYVLAVKMFKRRQKNGKESLMFVCVPLFGSDNKPIGKDDYAAVFENCTLTMDAIFRLDAICKAVGRTTPFNANSDREVSSVFVMKPFKAKIYHDEYGGKTSAKIKEYLEMTSSDEKRADVVLEDWQIDDNGGSYGGDQDSYGGYDDQAPPPGDGDRDGGSGGYKDEELPF